jgi:hypothetical protein
MAPQSLRTGWHSKGPDDHVFVWGSARDITDSRHRVIFVPTSGPDACHVLSLDVGNFLAQLARSGFKHTDKAPARLPPEFPRNLFVNKLA